MPKEKIAIESEKDRIGPAEVYVTLRDLIALQFEARGFSFLPKYAVQSILSGRHSSKLRGRGLDFDQVRKYISGDDIRNIDWKVTARMGVTHTKEFTEEKERPVFFVVDQSSSMFFGSKKYFKSVIAAHLAAVGCWRTLDVGDRAGGIVFNDSRIDFISPKRDRKTIQRYFTLIKTQNQELKAVKVDAFDEIPLNKVLKQVNELISHDYLVVLISDLNMADQNTLKNLIRIRKNNDIIVAHITDPGEMELISDNLTISDGEFQTQVGQGRKLRKEFKDTKEKTHERIKSDLKKYSIPYFRIDTLSEPAKQLRSLLSVKNKRPKK